MRLEVALGTDAGDLGRHLEQGMRHLAGDHVDFVEQRDGDQHVGPFGAGLGEHVGVGAVPDEAAHVERVADDWISCGEVSITDTSFCSAASLSAMP